MNKTTVKKSNEKSCWVCKRIILGRAPLGLCERCVDKFGTALVIHTVGSLFGPVGSILGIAQIAQREIESKSDI